MQEVLRELNELALTVSQTLQTKDHIGKQSIKEIHRLFDEMDKKIDQLHEKVRCSGGEGGKKNYN